MGNVDFSKLMKSNDVLPSLGPSIRAAARIEGAFTGTRGSLLTSALYAIRIREGCGKSKWKFKMAFAMKGGGSRGSRVPHTYFEK